MASRGLRRAAELADGWLASGYNTTPERFAASWARVREHVAARGADPDGFDNGIATLWAYVTEDRAAADRVLADVLSPLLGRPVESLRELSLPIGPAEVCAERLSDFAAAGARRLFLWPLGDEVRQLELLAERVVPHIAGARGRSRGGIGMRWALAVLVVASIAVGASTSRAAAAGPLPDCAPGTPAPAPPTAAVTGNPATPGRIVAGRFFTIVEAGQLLAPGIGGEGPDRAPRLDPLPRAGINTGGPPVIRRFWTCRGLHARVPVTAILREERNLRRRASTS